MGSKNGDVFVRCITLIRNKDTIGAFELGMMQKIPPRRGLQRCQ